MTDKEQARRADFAECPILEDYLASMLEDIQFSENDHACEEGREPFDTGTVYTLSDSEYEKHKADCFEFYTVNREDIETALDLEPGEDGLQYANGRYMTLERIGYYFYMTRVGHGVTFTDDGDAPCLQRLYEAAQGFGGFDGMVAADEDVYTM